MAEKHRKLTKYKIFKDPGADGLMIHTNKSSRRSRDFYGNTPLFFASDMDWVAFDRDSGYEDLEYELEEGKISGDDLRCLIEYKLYECELDREHLGGLSQEDLTIRYEKGYIPMKTEKFFDMIINCPVIEDEE